MTDYVPRDVSEHTLHLMRLMFNAMLQGEHAEAAEVRGRLVYRHLQTHDVLNGYYEALHDESVDVRMLAAYAVLRLDTEDHEAESRRFYTAEVVSLANDIMLDQLSTGDRRVFMVVCCLLMECQVNEAVGRALLPHLASSDAELSLMAAAALARSPLSDPRISKVLAKGLQAAADEDRAIAAVALLHLKLHDESYGILVDAMRSFDAAGQGRLWIAALAVEHDLSPLAPLAIETIRDPSADAEARGHAARASPRIIKDKQSLETLLLEQIHRKSCPWKLLSGAIDALVDIERLPAAAPVLAERLDHDHPQVRGVAARGMLMLKDKAAPYADLLVERLRVEQSLDLAEVLAAALVGLGSRSIKPLLELVDDGNLLRTELALRALTLTGPDGAAAVGELLRPGQSPRLHKLAASVLFQMGRRALPALPGLCRVLDTTTVPDVALNCVIAVTGMGPEATAAIPSLIVRLAEFDSKDDAAAEWAFVALLKLRGQAIPAVEAELERASGPSKERLSVLLARLTATSLGRTARLERIQDDGLVRDFVAVAGLIQAADPTKPPATRDLAKMLNERRVIPASAPAKDGKGWSQQRVSRTIKLMQEATKVRLTTVSCRQKGSLTPDVIRLLADARQYLELVALRQGEQN